MRSSRSSAASTGTGCGASAPSPAASIPASTWPRATSTATGTPTSSSGRGRARDRACASSRGRPAARIGAFFARRRAAARRARRGGRHRRRRPRRDRDGGRARRGPTVTIFRATGARVATLHPDLRARRGLWLAMGDLNGDKLADLVLGGDGKVLALGADGVRLRALRPFGAGARNRGLRVAIADVNADGTPEIAVARLRKGATLRAFTVGDLQARREPPGRPSAPGRGLPRLACTHGLGLLDGPRIPGAAGLDGAVRARRDLAARDAGRGARPGGAGPHLRAAAAAGEGARPVGGAPRPRAGRAGLRPAQARPDARGPRHDGVRAQRVRLPGARQRQLRDPRAGRAPTSRRTAGCTRCWPATSSRRSR